MICGIDEAGRGCLAGDLVVAGCVLKNDIKDLNDSKKLSEKKREELYEAITKNSLYKIVIFSSQEVDDLGLSKCLKNALLQIKNEFLNYRLIFDGNTNFGISKIETKIKADSLIAEVSAASILAKVTRDRRLVELDKMYPQYELLKHKGYGTALHIEKIKQFGLSQIHRKSYRIKALEPTLF